MRLWRGSLVALLLTTAMAVLPVALGVAAADDPATVLQRFTDARNRGDVAGAIALVTDDIRFVEDPAWPTTRASVLQRCAKSCKEPFPYTSS